jgi:prepilin-type N-terminal cleavage/methylation domain-containing protein
MMRAPGVSSSRGFTLIELLVAISILALIAVFSWRTLDAITRTSDALKVSSAKIDGLARVFSALERDVGNASDADLPAQGVLRLLAPGGSVTYRVDNNQLFRQLPGSDPGLLATGVMSIRIDLMRSAPTTLATLANAASQANQASSSGAAGINPRGSAGAAVPLPQNAPAALPVAGVMVALTLDDGEVVTRLMLLNSV